MIAVNKSPFLNDFHLSDVVAEHPWHEELARDSQRPREHCARNAGPQHYIWVEGKSVLIEICNAMQCNVLRWQCRSPTLYGGMPDICHKYYKWKNLQISGIMEGWEDSFDWNMPVCCPRLFSQL